MQSQRSWSPDQIDAAIMGMLLDDRFDIWAVAEIEREIGDSIATRDSLRRLRGTGLAHELANGFVMASRAARAAEDLPW